MSAGCRRAESKAQWMLLLALSCLLCVRQAVGILDAERVLPSEVSIAGHRFARRLAFLPPCALSAMAGSRALLPQVVAIAIVAPGPLPADTPCMRRQAQRMRSCHESSMVSPCASRVARRTHHARMPMGRCMLDEVQAAQAERGRIEESRLVLAGNSRITRIRACRHQAFIEMPHSLHSLLLKRPRYRENRASRAGQTTKTVRQLVVSDGGG